MMFNQVLSGPRSVTQIRNLFLLVSRPPAQSSIYVPPDIQTDIPVNKTLTHNSINLLKHFNQPDQLHLTGLYLEETRAKREHAAICSDSSSSIASADEIVQIVLVAVSLDNCIVLRWQSLLTKYRF